MHPMKHHMSKKWLSYEILALNLDKMKAINSIFISINSHIQNINDDKLIIIHIPYPNQCLHDIY